MFSLNLGYHGVPSWSHPQRLHAVHIGHRPTLHEQLALVAFGFMLLPTNFVRILYSSGSIRSQWIPRTLCTLKKHTVDDVTGRAVAIWKSLYEAALGLR